MYVFFLRKKRLLAVSAGIVSLLLVFYLVRMYLMADVPTINPIYIGNTQERAVALMINVDWGEDVLPQMISLFREKKIKTTFFITGKFAKKYPALITNIAAGGHEIGNHGYAHPHPDRISFEANKKDILDAEQVLLAIPVKMSKLFAPPYGERAKHVLEAADSLGYRTVMWTVDTVDWRDPAPDTIQQKIITKADNGALVLMHPKDCTLQALPSIIDTLQANGYTFKTVSEIIQ